MRTSPARPSLVRIVAVIGAIAIGLAGCTATNSAGSQPGDSTVAIANRSETTAGTTPAPLARYAGYTSVTHADPTHWVCRPEANDICKGNLDTTVINADGTMTIEPFHAATDPPIDCFYVYPTVSRDGTKYSDWSASPDEEGWTTLNQAARLRAGCRVFAPVYRQMTVKALVGGLGGAGTVAEGETVDPFTDVLDAFRTYMANDNKGRGFVLVGHSQGSAMLQRLISAEVDPNADVREKLVGAILAGWPLAVPEGADVGGQFQNVPLCRAADQLGCVYAWSSFRSTAPPGPAAYFGRLRTGTGVAACNTPVTLHDGVASDLHAYFPANRKSTFMATINEAHVAGDEWVDPSRGVVTTTFVSLPGLVTGTCTTTDGRHYLSLKINGNPSDPRADDIGGDLTPDWGMHLDDINGLMGDLVDWVKDRGAAYAAR